MRASIRKLLGVVGLSIFIVLPGCGEKSVPTAAKPAAQRTAPATAKTASGAAKVAEPVLEPPKYVYETGSRRDPFESLVSEKPIDKPSGDELVTPLQQYAVDQFRVIGVIVGKGQPAAMVTAPDGKGYVLRNGIKIGKNNGVVIAISASSVIVEEQNLDFSGALLKNQVELKLTKREGAK